MVRDSSVRRGNRWPRVGSFRYVASDDHWEWSDEVAQMHGYEPGRVVPTTDLLLTHKHPDEKPVVTQLVEWVRRHGAACGNRCRIVDTGGAVHLVIVVGNPWYDERGEFGGTAGFYVDITEQAEADLQMRMTDAIEAVSARRAVINQAMGVLMLRYGLNADSAFELLAKLSQRSNIKVRVLAERIVAHAVGRKALCEDATDAVNRLLHTAQSVSMQPSG